MISILNCVKELLDGVDAWSIRGISNALADIKSDLWECRVENKYIQDQIYDLAGLLEDNDEIMELSINNVKDILNKIQITLEGLVQG